jgi:alpha-D-xyloside xylohydrolase
MLRAMLLEFPDDPTCNYLDQQYMLGDSLLVAPIFSHDGSVRFYVPEGRWTNLLNGTVIEGPRWVQETHDFMSLPLLVRPNSIIPMGNRSDRPDYDYSDGVTLHMSHLEDGKNARVEVPSSKGEIETVFEVKCEGNTIHVHRQGPRKAWRVFVHGMEFVRAEASTDELSIQLQS